MKSDGFIAEPACKLFALHMHVADRMIFVLFAACFKTDKLFRPDHLAQDPRASLTRAEILIAHCFAKLKFLLPCFTDQV